MGNKNDPVIESKIKLTIAMGINEGMTAEQVSDRWTEWSNTYPGAAATLSPAVRASFSALEASVAVYKVIVTVPPTIENAVVKAGEAYTLALSLLPGVGAAGGAKLAIEKSMALLKTKIAEAALRLRDIPVTIYKQLTNVKVDENALI